MLHRTALHLRQLALHGKNTNLAFAFRDYEEQFLVVLESFAGDGERIHLADWIKMKQSLHTVTLFLLY